MQVRVSIARPAEGSAVRTDDAHPGMVTRIIIRFEGYTGRYMWHCHILEHGDNEMMRPMVIVPTRQEGRATRPD